MLSASEIFYKQAQEISNEMELHKGDEKQLREYRKVLGQLLFYAGINAIEEILSKKLSIYSVGNHEKRGEFLSRHKDLFKNGETIERYYRILTWPEIDYRRKVAYKGENGNKLALMKEFAKLCIEAKKQSFSEHRKSEGFSSEIKNG